jgi:ribosome-associated translation inhibitor RaiA
MSELARFTEQFFQSINAHVSWKGTTLEVTKVPESFESWAGKKAPYRLVFTPADEQSDTDLITKGSFLLKSMTSFLEQKGQTTLSFLTPITDPQKRITESLNLKNTSITHSTKVVSFTPLYEFTFATTVAYLAKKEQNLHTIYIYDGKRVSFDPSKFEKVPSSATLDTANLKPSYECAKAATRENIQATIKKAATELQEKLTKEHARIKAHYENHRREVQVIKLKTEAQLQDALKENNFPKIAKLQENLKQLAHPELLTKLETEEQFFLADERQKHALGVDTKLVSTTVYGIPQYLFTFILSGKNITRQLSIPFSLLSPSLSFSCESCALPLREIWCCTSGHLSCLPCLAGCDVCRQPVCKRCRIQKCTSCGKDLCKSCAARCPGCLSIKCTSHFSNDYITAQKRCLTCLKTCTSCKKSTSFSSMRPCDKCTKPYCKPCASASFEKGRCKGCRSSFR